VLRALSRAGLTLVGLGMSALFLWLAVRNVDLELFWQALGDSDYLWLLPALGLIAVGVVIRAWRWQFLFYRETRPPLPPLVRAILVGLLFNSILPARAGEAARIVVLHQETGTSRVEALGTAVVERVYDVLALFVLLFVATPFMPEVTWLRRAAVIGLALTALVAVAVFVVERYGERPILFVLRPLKRIPRIPDESVDRAGRNLVQGLGALHRPHLAAPAFALTVASWLMLALSFWCVLAAFGLGGLGYDAALLMLVTTTLALVIPSAPGGLGVFEAGGVLALHAYGVDQSIALSATVVAHALNLFPYIAAGAIVLHRHVRLLPALREEAKARLDA
jgi:glycosyltransferase 2 family protein